jgi:hypothetical protein
LRVPSEAVVSRMTEGTLHHRRGGKRLAQGLGEIGHRGDVVDEALVHPAHDLLRAKRLLASFGEVSGERRLVEVEKVHETVSGCKWRARERNRQLPYAPSPARPSRGPRWRRWTARSRRGWCRPPPSWVGGAHELAVLRDRAVPLEHLDHHRARGHELDEVAEKGPLLVNRIKSFGFGARQPRHARGDDFEAGLLESGQDFADRVLGYRVALEMLERAFRPPFIAPLPEDFEKIIRRNPIF